MEVLSLHSKYHSPICLALGFFDCVHLGHRALIDAVKAQAQATQSVACVATFSDNPNRIVGKSEKLIFSLEERLKIFSDMEVDAVILMPFDASFVQQTKEEFLYMLFNTYTVRGVVCGHDYRFGAKAQGDAQYLENFALNSNSMCDILSPITYNGKRISTTNIRDALLCGDIPLAQTLLGHSYFIDGTVCHGRGVGKLFDFPTANLLYDAEKLLPAQGVYATVTTVQGMQYKSVTNIGNKPTFGEENLSVETMLCDFSGDLYEKPIQVEFVRKLRDIRKFDSPYKLKEQIYTDAQWR